MSSDNIPVLAISTNSWHFKYSCFIKSQFGIKTDAAKATSLCPYFQTMFWLSILYVLTLPLQIVGWCTLRFCRWFYRYCEMNQFTGLVDFIDNGTPLGSELDESDWRMKEMPVLACLNWFMLAFLVILVSSAVVGLLIVCCYHGIAWIPKLPSLIYTGVLNIGWTVFMICASIAYGFVFMYHAIKLLGMELCKNVIWLLGSQWFWQWVLYLVGWALTLLSGMFLTAIGIFHLANSSFYEYWHEWIMMRINGYHEAAEHAAERRAEEAKATSDPTEQTEKRQFIGTAIFLSLVDFCEESGVVIGNISVSVYSTTKNFFVSRDVEVNGVKHRIISPFSIVVSYFWAIKKQACPVIKFVDSSEK